MPVQLDITTRVQEANRTILDLLNGKMFWRSLSDLPGYRIE